MVSGTNSEPSNRRGPSGGCVLAVAVVGVVLACLWHLPARVRDGSGQPLIEQAQWAVGMAVTAGMALASIRRGPIERRGAAYLALGVCLLSVGWVAVKLAAALLR
jgi:hypothetical protein